MVEQPAGGKLVRDGIPDLIRRSGEHPVVEVLSLARYREALRDKLFEEVEELRSADLEHLAEEIGDVVEVLRAIARVEGIDWAKVESVRAEKREERGAFDQRIWLSD